MHPAIKFVLIIVLSIISYCLLRSKLPDLKKYSAFIVLFGVIFIFLGSALVFFKYDRDTLIQCALLKKSVFLDRFILIGYSIVVFGIFSIIDNISFHFLRFIKK